MAFDRIAVLGAGAWGTALANAAARAGGTVTLLARDAAAAAAMTTKRESPRLPGVRLADSVTVAAAGHGVAQVDAVLLVVPAQALREAVQPLAATLKPATPIIVCAKGIEQRTRRFMTEIVAEVLPTARPAVLSGPSFAAEVARELPAAVTLAAADEALARALTQALGSQVFRLYHSTDVRGVEIGGAAKNVLAIAAGIVTGRKLGLSAAAALTTRGFAELARFGRAYGARAETLMGLSGLGDLILTCSGPQSRNFALGVALGQGRPHDEIAREEQLAEGALTAPALIELAQAKGVDMPIAAAVAAVIAGRLSVDGAIEALLSRPFRSEM